MSAPRKDRLEAYLAKSRLVRYAAVTGSAVALTVNPAAATPRSQEPMLRSAVLSMVTGAAAGAAFDFTKAASTAPTIATGGVVPLYGTVNTIQPGGWASIYGTNLAAGTALWAGDFPQSLNGTSVTINGRPAYLYYVSAGQINFQAPDDTTTGPVAVVVTTSAGVATSTVTLGLVSPSFSLQDQMHVSAIILRSNGSGAYDNGAYDIAGPDGDCYGYPTVGAKPGDLVEVFGVGFGPTNPVVHAGQAYSGAAPLTQPLYLYINNMLVTPTFVGLSSAGLYQINFVVPLGLGAGDVPIAAYVGGMSTQKGVLFSLQGSVFPPACAIGDGDGSGVGDGGYTGDGGYGDGYGDGGYGDGGDGGGGGDGGDGGDGDGG